METEVSNVIPFLDVLIENRNNTLKTTYHRLTYFCLLLNFKNFTSCFYKISLRKCLIDCAYYLNNTWDSFHNGITKINDTLKCNSFPSFLIDKTAKSYLGKVHTRHDQVNSENYKKCFYKLLYIGKYSDHI